MCFWLVECGSGCRPYNLNNGKSTLCLSSSTIPTGCWRDRIWTFEPQRIHPPKRLLTPLLWGEYSDSLKSGRMPLLIFQEQRWQAKPWMRHSPIQSAGSSWGSTPHAPPGRCTLPFKRSRSCRDASRFVFGSSHRKVKTTRIEKANGMLGFEHVAMCQNPVLPVNSPIPTKID